MAHSTGQQVLEFNVAGEFLEWIAKNGKLKYMRLQLDSETMLIKLPKAVRLSLLPVLRSGDRVQVSGYGKFNPATGKLKFKGQQVKALAEDAPTSAIVPRATVREPRPVKSKLKILLCQKSGCLKRGGKKLGQALEQVLQSQNLQDQITIERTGCQKRCSKAPNFVVMPGKHRYGGLRPKDLDRVLANHIEPYPVQ